MFEIFDEFLKLQFIDMPSIKRPNKLKKLMIQMVTGIIDLWVNLLKNVFFKERNYDKASNNHISITFGSLDSV